MLPNGAEWVDLEVWNNGTPIRIVADGIEKDVPCFEVSFSENDEKVSATLTVRNDVEPKKYDLYLTFIGSDEGFVQIDQKYLQKHSRTFSVNVLE